MRYQTAGVEYWIVDPDARLLERWLPDADRPLVHTDSITWKPTADAPILTVDLAPIFAEALGEQ